MSDVRWEGYSHDEIWALVQQGPGREASAGPESVWSSAAETIVRIERGLAGAARELGVGWEGLAADATGAAITQLGRWALDAADSAHRSAATVTDQGGHAGEVRRLMPPPRTAEREAEYHEALTDPTYLFRVGDLHQIDAAIAEDTARAVDLMNGYTDGSDRRAAQIAPLTPPPQVVVEIGPASASGAGGGAGPAGFPGGDSTGSAAAGSGYTGAGAGGGAGWPGGGAADVRGTGSGLAPGGPAGPGPGGVAVTGAGAGTNALGAWPAGGAASAGPAGPGGMGPGGTGPGGAGPGAWGAGARAGGTAGPGAARRGGGAGADGRNGTRSGPVVPRPPVRSVPPPTWRDVVGGTGGALDRGAAGGSGVGRGGDIGRGGAGFGRSVGWPGVGAPPEGDGVRGPVRGGPVEPLPGRGVPAGEAHPAAGTRTTAGHPGIYPPMGAMGGQTGGRERARPDYLLEDADVFAVDIWTGPAVIGGEDDAGDPPRRH